MSGRALIELLYGKGAHANPVACVEDLSLELSGRRIEGFPHSIWQLVSHMNYWMDYELRRIRGEAPKYPEELARDVEAMDPCHAKQASSRRDVLWQTLVHNSYHLGQIATLRRCLGAWPPRGGGDTW